MKLLEGMDFAEVLRFLRDAILWEFRGYLLVVCGLLFILALGLLVPLVGSHVAQQQIEAERQAESGVDLAAD